MLTVEKTRLTEIEEKAYVLICQRRVGTDALAEGLRVSRSTAARLVASLRQKGVRIVSVREGGAWHFELRNREDAARERWRRLRGMVGCVKDWNPRPGKDEDAVIYDED
jgi:predicted transcriptional regulator